MKTGQLRSRPIRCPNGHLIGKRGRSCKVCGLPAPDLNTESAATHVAATSKTLTPARALPTTSGKTVVKDKHWLRGRLTPVGGSGEVAGAGRRGDAGTRHITPSTQLGASSPALRNADRSIGRRSSGKQETFVSAAVELQGDAKMVIRSDGTGAWRIENRRVVLVGLLADGTTKRIGLPVPVSGPGPETSGKQGASSDLDEKLGPLRRAARAEGLVEQPKTPGAPWFEIRFTLKSTTLSPPIEQVQPVVHNVKKGTVEAGSTGIKRSAQQTFNAPAPQPQGKRSVVASEAPSAARTATAQPDIRTRPSVHRLPISADTVEVTIALKARGELLSPHDLRRPVSVSGLTLVLVATNAAGERRVLGQSPTTYALDNINAPDPPILQELTRLRELLLGNGLIEVPGRSEPWFMRRFQPQGRDL